jgi:hypothetical protein
VTTRPTPATQCRFHNLFRQNRLRQSWRSASTLPKSNLLRKL